MIRWPIIILLIFSFNSYAKYSKAIKYYKSNHKNKNILIAQELIKSKYYFSATYFLKQHLVESNQYSKELENMMEMVALKTGPLSFSNLHDSYLLKFNSHSLKFIHGLKSFRYKRYQSAINSLIKIPLDHRLAPESVFILGSSYQMKEQFDKARIYYKQCITLAEKNEDEAEHKKLKQYFGIIKESCIIHQARMEYRKGNYKRSLKIYDLIPKTSFRWPYILIEKAWVHYMLDDYNRSLGTLVTYKSPLLTSYFFPEAEYLTALNYFKLCLWGDSNQVIEHYYTTYKPRSEELKKFLISHKSSHTYFLKILLSPIKDWENMSPYMRNLMTQVRKKIKFNLELINFKKVQNEMKYLVQRSKKKKDPLTTLLISEVKKMQSWRTKHLNHYIKKQMFSFINEIHRYSYEQFNIRLEIMALKRELVYDNKKLISNRSRGSLDNVTRTQKQHFYDFMGEFWADELGDYSFGLKSNCKKVKNKNK
jgi:tetratricopeptide (TPR) repeat protein